MCHVVKMAFSDVHLMEYSNGMGGGLPLAFAFECGELRGSAVQKGENKRG